MIYRVDLTDEALGKIRDQARYIAEEAGEPVNAGRWLAGVLESVDTLERWPRRCAVADEDAFFTIEIRKLNIDGFLLLFTVDDDAGVVTVLNARHGRQLPITPKKDDQ